MKIIVFFFLFEDDAASVDSFVRHEKELEENEHDEHKKHELQEAQGKTERCRLNFL